MNSQKIIITDIQNPKFQSNIKPVVTVRKHTKKEKSNHPNTEPVIKTGRAQTQGTIRDYLIEDQYEQSQDADIPDPFPYRTKPRPTAKFSFHPEFNAHFAIKDQVKVKRRDNNELADVQWFGGNLPLNRNQREVFFPHSQQELSIGIIETEAVIKKISNSGAPISQRVNIVYEDPQIAAMEIHEARVREEQEKASKVEHFRNKVKERVIKLQREEKNKKKLLSEHKSPTRQEKIKSYADKIHKTNLRRYTREAQKRLEEQDKAKKYKELIEKQQEMAKKQQLQQMEQEIYASKLPDRHAHQFPSRPDRSRESRGSIGTVSKKSVLHSARIRPNHPHSPPHSEGGQTARSIPLSGRSDQDLQVDSGIPNTQIPKLPLNSLNHIETSSAEGSEDVYQNYVHARDQAVLEEDRYIEALRLQLISKVKQQNIRLPPLCGCGLDPFDNHPLKCCNNCEFYRKPSAYVRQLESLLFSYGVSI